MKMNIKMILKQKLSRVTRGVLGACVALGAWAAVAAPSVEITYVEIANAREGTVEYSYTVSGDFKGREYDLLFTVSAKDGTKSAVLTNKNVTAGSRTETVNVKTLLGKAYPGVLIFAKLKPQPMPGQLWEDGPIFAECNVGATKPEDAGYRFWWGDTVGYTQAVNKAWISADGKGTIINFSQSHTTANQTHNKDNAWLTGNGWIGQSGNLLPAHDAATVRLGAPWRMMTEDELKLLTSMDYCQWEWVTSYKGKSVSGYVVKGKAGTDYENNEVFFPYVSGAGQYWSSSPFKMNDFIGGCALMINSSTFDGSGGTARFVGLSVRAVRDCDD